MKKVILVGIVYFKKADNNYSSSRNLVQTTLKT